MALATIPLAHIPSDFVFRSGSFKERSQITQFIDSRRLLTFNSPFYSELPVRQAQNHNNFSKLDFPEINVSQLDTSNSLYFSNGLFLARE